MYMYYYCSYTYVQCTKHLLVIIFFQEQLLDASENGDKETVVSLLDKGVDPNYKNSVSFGYLELYRIY